MGNMKYVVGYSPDARGRSALQLGVVLARSLGAELDVVYVIKPQSPRLAAPRSNFEDLLQKQAVQWLEEAQHYVPAQVVARFHLRRANSAVSGLLELADAIDAGLIIVGGGNTGNWLWHSLGAVGNALLHRSRIPVALAPRKYSASHTIKQFDCAVSPDIDSINLVEEAIATQNRTGIPVRLVSLYEEGNDLDDTTYRSIIQDLVDQSAVKPINPQQLSIAVGAGTTIVEAVDSVHWNEDSVLMAGSSKLAQRGELFLSSTTAKIMTKLPIPLVVVPRDYHPGRKGSQQQPWTGSIPIIKQ
ncbi:universal stress protein [Rothia sp. HMSC067H10]|nr:universal stress protein [Rothia sp. HMSC067H10]